MKSPKHIHFVGIKGVGMTPLAIIAKEAGFQVTGSDIEEEYITDEPLKKAGITPLIGFSPDYLGNAGLVITTGAHGGYDNPEVVSAKARSIAILSQGQAVGEFMKGALFNRTLEGVSIAGSHGKTTSTAMIATILKHAGADPSYVIGTGEIPSLGSPGHYGRGKYFIAEADEYATEPVHDKTIKFLWQHPKIALFTNIELDHTDLYNSTDDIREVFLQFAKQLPLDGVLIINADDPELGILKQGYTGRIVTFGKSAHSDYRLTKIHVSSEQTFFWVEMQGADLGEFVIRSPGEHNATNALGAIIVALEAGISIEAARKALVTYSGSKRRLEFIGELPGNIRLYDDYAHHPTEIRKTLQSLKAQFPKSHIVCIFQPHTYSRTKALFDEFARSFTNASEVILTDIYPSQREEPDTSISSAMLVNTTGRYHAWVRYLPSLQNVIEYVAKSAYPRNTIIITMGAGDVYKINEKLKAKNEK